MIWGDTLLWKQQPGPPFLDWFTSDALQLTLGGRSPMEDMGLLRVLLGFRCCSSSSREQFALCSQCGFLGGLCDWHGTGWGDAASLGLCGLAARKMLMHSLVGLAEVLQGLSLGFCTPQVL